MEVQLFASKHHQLPETLCNARINGSEHSGGAERAGADLVHLPVDHHRPHKFRGNLYGLLFLCELQI